MLPVVYSIKAFSNRNPVTLFESYHSWESCEKLVDDLRVHFPST